MNPDLQQAILECIADYLDQRYDGGPTPSWLDTLALEYSRSVGGTRGPAMWSFIEAEVREYLEQMKEVDDAISEAS